MGSSAAAAEVPSSLRIPNVAAAVPLSDRQKCRRLRKEKKKNLRKEFPYNLKDFFKDSSLIEKFYEFDQFISSQFRRNFMILVTAEEYTSSYSHFSLIMAKSSCQRVFQSSCQFLQETIPLSTN